jgi:hypothetical protein
LIAAAFIDVGPLWSRRLTAARSANYRKKGNGAFIAMDHGKRPAKTGVDAASSNGPVNGQTRRCANNRI